MPSKFFYVTILFGIVTWFITKSLKVGLLPIIIYLFVRLVINLMLMFTKSGERP